VLAATATRRIIHGSAAQYHRDQRDQQRSEHQSRHQHRQAIGHISMVRSLVDGGSGVVGVIGVLVAIPACALATERFWYGAAVFRRAGSTRYWFLCHERSSLCGLLTHPRFTGDSAIAVGPL
jgi:hypothetical protein